MGQNNFQCWFQDRAGWPARILSHWRDCSSSVPRDDYDGIWPYIEDYWTRCRQYLWVFSMLLLLFASIIVLLGRQPHAGIFWYFCCFVPSEYSKEIIGYSSTAIICCLIGHLFDYDWAMHSSTYLFTFFKLFVNFSQQTS